MTDLIVGLFVGGRGLRMGGARKGLLLAPDTGEPLIERTLRLIRQVRPAAELCLVGSAQSYELLGLATVSDDPVGCGPIGGLRALLARARERHISQTLAVACDLPYLTFALLERLITESPAATALCPRIEGIWQPMLARYRSEPALEAVDAGLSASEHALFRVLERLRATALDLDAEEVMSLRDWDSPEDMRSR